MLKAVHECVYWAVVCLNPFVIVMRDSLEEAFTDLLGILIEMKRDCNDD